MYNLVSSKLVHLLRKETIFTEMDKYTGMHVILALS